VLDSEKERSGMGTTPSKSLQKVSKTNENWLKTVILKSQEFTVIA
jgi:hypothetical protein